MSKRAIPEKLTAYLLGILGIGYEVNLEPRGNAFIFRFMNGFPGGFCVSIDFDNRREERVDADKKATLELLALCEEFNIPVTWAICGVTAIRERDVFECILNSKVKHEIAVHTFDHIDFSKCSEELARSQVLDTIKLFPSEIKCTTFIFPWNRTGHFELLREMGFIAYRGRERKLAYPSRNNGLWNLHPLFYLYEKNYTHSSVLKALLDLAISREAIFHLWFHPWNLEVAGDVSKYIKDTIRPLFEYADLKRKDGELWICTLGELANYCEARSGTKVHHRERNGSIEIGIERRMEDAGFSKGQVLTLGVKIPDGIAKIKASLEGNPLQEDRLILKGLSREGRFLLLNLLLDKPFTLVTIEFIKGI